MHKNILITELGKIVGFGKSAHCFQSDGAIFTRCDTTKITPLAIPLPTAAQQAAAVLSLTYRFKKNHDFVVWSPGLLYNSKYEN
jgi:hypothetical protein